MCKYFWDTLYVCINTSEVHCSVSKRFLERNCERSGNFPVELHFGCDPRSYLAEESQHSIVCDIHAGQRLSNPRFFCTQDSKAVGRVANILRFGDCCFAFLSGAETDWKSGTTSRHILSQINLLHASILIISSRTCVGLQHFRLRAWRTRGRLEPLGSPSVRPLVRVSGLENVERSSH